MLSITKIQMVTYLLMCLYTDRYTYIYYNLTAKSIYIAHRSWVLIPFSNKRNGGFLQKWLNLGLGLGGEIQKVKLVFKKKNKTRQNKKPSTDVAMSGRCKRKSSQMAKAATT